ncbi:MAG TPA: anaerobic sulfatase maturase [Terriglobia bacterium]|nr:anaerobic sulfatase maturase [Terriglobia bacterium]
MDVSLPVLTRDPASESRSVRPFHIMTKPTGAICNLDCSYCFYLEKEALYPEHRAHRDFRLSDSLLENYIRQYIAQQNTSEIHFAWQGGEPTLMGLDFFRRVVELQDTHAAGKHIHNALQTNGILLTDEWCAFLRKHGFLVGLSIDGPAELHDGYRKDESGKGTHARVMAAWQRLKDHDVDVNTMTVVHRQNAVKPMEVYSFLKEIGSRVMQFIPLVERVRHAESESGGKAEAFCGPPDPLKPRPDPAAMVTPWSVLPGDYGTFLIAIFDHWVRRDVGSVFVTPFDWQLAIELGMPSPTCIFSETCGRALAMEHNGDVYACDHYVYPEHLRGNIARETLAEMVDGPAQRAFGAAKRDTLPAYCRRCEVRQHCWGECPKHRFMTTPDGEPGLQYLCPSYKQFFTHIKPRLRLMASLIRMRRAPAEIMRMV